MPGRGGTKAERRKSQGAPTSVYNPGVSAYISSQVPLPAAYSITTGNFIMHTHTHTHVLKPHLHTPHYLTHLPHTNTHTHTLQ